METNARFDALVERMGAFMTASPAANPEAAAAVPSMVLLTPKVKKMMLEDNPEAYLVMFERVATAARWPQEWWTVQLTSCLNVAVTEMFPYPVILGRDWPKYKQVVVEKLMPVPHIHAIVAEQKMGDYICRIFPLHAKIFPTHFCPRNTKKEKG